MKRMIVMMMLTLPLFMAVAGCSALDDTGSDMQGKWVSFGMVSKSNDGEVEEILADNGYVLKVKSNMIPQYRMDEGERVLVNYSILGPLPDEDSRAGNEIKLYLAQKILNKPPVTESFIKLDEAHRNDSIGNDAVDADYAWFGGKYLNIRVGVMRNDPQTAHMVNLVWDDTNPDKTKAYVTLRHNAMGDQARYISYGIVSFDISSLLPDGADQVTVHLSWKGTGGQDRSDEGVFSPYKNTQNVPGNMHDDTLLK